MSFLTQLFTCCLPSSYTVPLITINNNSYKIIKLLGEGGFSYVYLVQSPNGSQYALKKIHAQFGNAGTTFVVDEEDDTDTDTYQQAMNEIYNYSEFQSPYIMKTIAHSVVQNPDGSKDVYILLPFFEQSLHDIISGKVLNGEKMTKTEILKITIGIARGLQVMHKHQKSRNPHPAAQPADQQTLLGASEDTELQSFDLQPLAHRDLKPANVMLSQTGLPVLVDLGSTQPARSTPQTKHQALQIQEQAAQQSTIYYRAPELLEVAVGEPISEKTDVWSLGCVVFAMMYGGLSPFEKMEMEQGGNVNMAISMGEIRFPSTRADMEDLQDLIRQCLAVNPQERIGVDEVITVCLEIQSSL
ncbi:hypothetical protein BABINDRAFT_37588 [Babjeviella inositovora NRRL Y-12698]|uniref:non-specific serine/threonine protein kinase n=1 Tax=Babjeviella inositovora NRRL Y-12698 TaxID=984486 RepID=A0A1E3QP97_9ASCO|nr:uncharacterized protein BABINDRAFT_37588 [Babjeviella inositovora NRRL Y-12698]ODQ79458.1 hypothetical protein BABINDRAFT_37588 [Babjeviella inositovora NRRL Y-12698]